MSKHTKPDGRDVDPDDWQLKNRRDFLKTLGKWSSIIIGGVALGGGWRRTRPLVGLMAAEVGSMHEAAVAAGLTRLVAAAAAGSTVGRGGGSWVNRGLIDLESPVGFG